MAGKEPRYVECKWKDAHSDGVADTTVEQAHVNHHPLIMRTRGWLLGDDAEGISLYCETCDTTGSYRGHTFVPRELVLSVEDFPKKRPRKAKEPAPVPA